MIIPGPNPIQNYHVQQVGGYCQDLDWQRYHAFHKSLFKKIVKNLKKDVLGQLRSRFHKLVTSVIFKRYKNDASDLQGIALFSSLFTKGFDSETTSCRHIRFITMKYLSGRVVIQFKNFVVCVKAISSIQFCLKMRGILIIIMAWQFN